MTELAHEIDLPAMDVGAPEPVLVWGAITALLYYLVATASTNSASLTWTAPTYIGPNPITSYTVTPVVDGKASTPITVGGNGNGANIPNLPGGAGGSCIDIIGGSGSGLEPLQRDHVRLLKAEVATGSSGNHAEVTVINRLGVRTPLVLAISAVGYKANGTICDQGSGYQDSCRTDIRAPRGGSPGTITDDQRGAVWWGNLL